jgi:hypothetical protein
MTTEAPGALALPTWRPLAEYLLDPANGWEPEINIAPSTSGTVHLSDYVRFMRRRGHRRGALGVDVRADGSVWLTNFGAHWWRVIFDSPGNRRSVAPVPASVIVAAIRAAVDEEG